MNVKEFNHIVSGEAGEMGRNNLYSIEIYLPRGHKNGGIGGHFGDFYTGTDEGGTKFLSYKAKTVTIPGKSLGTIEAKRFGPVYKVANDLIIDTVSMTFMCSADYAEHRFFEGWIAGIMGAVKPGTGMSAGQKTRQLYTVSYYYDYVGQVNIIPLDRQGGASANIVLMEAYPTNVGPIEMAWGDAGEISNFTVTWSFKDWNHTSVTGWSADGRDSIATGANYESDTKFQDSVDRKERKDAYKFGEGVVPEYRDAPGNTGDLGNYEQVSADGTRISTVPHETKRAPGKEGSGQYT
tara:strand:- start:597 stop:1478 length:882 start_codon:yes stop_codon:yes gene_type:complete